MTDDFDLSMQRVLALAQRWHDTDHPPLASDPQRSACWCCCRRCAPAYSRRPSPYYRTARMITFMLDETPHGLEETRE